MKSIDIASQASPRGQRYWSGFSVWLFIVLLSVFTWMLHRRVAQYEASQAGTHSTALKVCLNDRNQAAINSASAMEGCAGLLLFLVLAVALTALLDGPCFHPSLTVWQHPARTRFRPSLTHFFFLPPPAAQMCF